MILAVTREIDRREFLSRGAAVGAGVALLGAAGCGPGFRPGGTRGAPPGRPHGTTLVSAVQRPDGPGYVRVVEGPGWPTVVRDDLAPVAAGAGRGAPRRTRSGAGPSRRALASVVHLTDIHLIDAQSAGRVEFLDPFGDPLTAAFRPQEVLTTHVAVAMVRRIRALRRGPITGRRFDCAVSTGDNVDNQQRNELDWFLTILDGGRFRPDSGDRGRYEGVQDGVLADDRYWHPDPAFPDRYKRDLAFPSYPGLLDAAIAPLRSPGLRIPWYSTYGNHDGLLQGNVPATAAFDEILVGGRKIVDPGPMGPAALLALFFGDPQKVLDELRAGNLPYRTVTPDARRRSVPPREWVQAHLDSPPFPGPRGHGYTPDHLEAPALYYDFRIAPGVRGVSLDTGGYNSGSIGEDQLRWLESRLRAVHSRYYDAAGHAVRTGHDDELVIVFSHYNRGTMNTPMVDPARPHERRVLGPELVDTLLRYPNVVAWVNGHHHQNAVHPVPDPSGRGGGFWDVNTASHVDHPQHARIVELVDNLDGTLSIFCTMIDHVAPARVDPGARDPLALASISRELAANDPQTNRAGHLGTPLDLNVELRIAAPFAPSAVGVDGRAPATTG